MPAAAPPRHARALAALLAAGVAAAGAAGAVERGELRTVLVSKSAGVADVDVRFACRHRLVAAPPPAPAARAGLALERLDDCPAVAARESTRPDGRALAALEEIGYETAEGVGATLTLRFDRAVRVTVAQSGDLRALRVRVEVPPGSAPDPAAAAAPAPAPAAAAAGPDAARVARAGERARRAAAAAPAPATVVPLYAINLRSAREPIDARAEAAGLAAPGQLAYVADTAFAGATWHRLRLGFFASEDEAHAAWQRLRARYPDAWVTKVTPDERAAAGGATPAPAATVAAAGTAALAPAEVQALVADARAAIVDRDYPRAIGLASRAVGGAPAPQAAEARELLGLARERSGEAALAQAEYRRYLADYPDAEGAARVRQRLDALATAREQPRASLRGAGAPARASAWSAEGGFAQHYRRDSLDFGGDAEAVDQSALFTDGDLVLRRAGERFDFTSRATLGHVLDTTGGEYAPDDEARVYNLYADLADRDLGLSARLGRQSLRNQGVLGRFDGLYASWQLAPAYRLNVLGGFPVYEPGEGPETDRRFVGMSVDVLQFLDVVDVNLFVNLQEVDGINDRQAVGAEVRYFDATKSLVAALDYDFGYGELNSLVALGNWTFADRVTVNGMVDWRKAPFLTTENALIEQPDSSIQELLLTYSEGEIRQLALDRSGALQSVALGVSLPLSVRFDLSADFTASQYDGTPASGGAPETPDPGTLSYGYLSLVGTSLLVEGDVSILGLRYADSGDWRTAGILLDTRFPLGRDLRLNPKLLVSRREIVPGDHTELIVTPGLRLLWRVARHWRVELEGGGHFGTSDAAGASSSPSGYYLNLGYQADF